MGQLDMPANAPAASIEAQLVPHCQSFSRQRPATVPFRVLEPSGILIAGDAFSDLQDGKHSAHPNRAEGPVPAIIGSVFFGVPMFMSAISPMPVEPIAM